MPSIAMLRPGQKGVSKQRVPQGHQCEACARAWCPRLPWRTLFGCARARIHAARTKDAACVMVALLPVELLHELDARQQLFLADLAILVGVNVLHQDIGVNATCVGARSHRRESGRAADLHVQDACARLIQRNGTPGIRR